MENRLFCRQLIHLIVVLPVMSFSSTAEAGPEVSGSAEKGRIIFDQKCSPCHTLGGGKKIGPDLKGVTERRKKDWLMKWIASPADMIESGDPVAKEIVKDYPIQMPVPGLSEAEISEVLDYLESYKSMPPSPGLLPLKKEKGYGISLTSRTYLQFFDDPRGSRYNRLLERMDLDLEKGNKWSFHSSGFVRYDARSFTGEQRELDELTYAFLSYTPLSDRSLVFNLGRYYFFDGVAAEQVDGISSRWEITRSTGISVFGGRPVETEFDGKRGDYVYGGRLYQRIGKRAEVGVSVLKEDNDRARFREEYGMDLWLLPLKDWQVQGHSYWNNITEGWMEHSYNIRVRIHDVTLVALYSRTDYDNAFSARTLSAFSPEFLGRGERLAKAGVSGEYRAGKHIILVADLMEFHYSKSGTAWYFGGGGTADFKAVSAGASVHRMDGPDERLRYVEARAYFKKTVRQAALVIDAIYLHYDLPFAGLSNAYSVSGTAVVGISRVLSAGADVTYTKSPDFTNNTMVLLKLIYNLKKEL